MLDANHSRGAMTCPWWDWKLGLGSHEQQGFWKGKEGKLFLSKMSWSFMMTVCTMIDW